MAVAASQASTGGAAPAGWAELRADPAIQFEPVTLPQQALREPGWLQRFLEWLGNLVGDSLGGALGDSWPVLRWLLLAIMIAALLFVLWRIFDPLARRKLAQADEASQEEWRPDQADAIALLEDADRLATSGRFNEATHLLLQRSVSHISARRPEWVAPSSTARELALLPALPDSARQAFRTIAERVERSLFALRELERADWDAARAAYAEFALARFEGVGA